ncbi:hypothetical protein LTR56_002374 [Elasticomyces elasticus]|nr:hypothetical protein LTR56_002374 [Elasticomyces elasticus]KAK3665938.1 hypothetical protein LTR22_003257 [Elasticomyces elasticus]KAK4929410.1 hypothetical protein LTR49_004014 [Elasticomyces elasticus]KAK5764699.1 hypothetical protein LTS12_005200 [Elasticomyces elasticus]
MPTTKITTTLPTEAGTMTGITAGGKLASTPEHLEMILLQLQLPKILLAQRVNHTWCAVIRESSKLQQALFFKPASDILLAYPDCVPWTLPCSSAVDCRLSLEPPRPRHEGDVCWEFKVANTQKAYYPVMNPLTIKLWPKQRVTHKYFEFRLEDQYAAVARREASWRRMLFTQPPVINLMHWHEVVATSAVGVTLGDIERRSDAFNSGPRSSYMIPGRLTIPLERAMEGTAEKTFESIRHRES